MRALWQASDYLGELARKREKAAAAAGGGEGGAGRKRRLGAGGAEGPLLTELFTIGQLVRCCVVGLEGGGEDGGDDGGKKRKKVQLSLHVKHVNKELGGLFTERSCFLLRFLCYVSGYGISGAQVGRLNSLSPAGAPPLPSGPRLRVCEGGRGAAGLRALGGGPRLHTHHWHQGAPAGLGWAGLFPERSPSLWAHGKLLPL